MEKFWKWGKTRSSRKKNFFDGSLLRCKWPRNKFFWQRSPKFFHISSDLGAYNMIIPRKCNSFLRGSSPRNSVSGYLASILRVRCIAIIILINDRDWLGFAVRRASDIEEYCHMFAVCCRESVIWLTIETRNHHPLVERRQVTLWHSHKIHKWLNRFPLTCRHLSLVSYRLGKRNTLSAISRSERWLRKLRICTIGRIRHCPRTRIVRHQIEILRIHRRTPNSQNTSSWNYLTFPVLGGDTIEKRQNIRVWGLERCGHNIIQLEYYSYSLLHIFYILPHLSFLQSRLNKNLSYHYQIFS